MEPVAERGERFRGVAARVPPSASDTRKKIHTKLHFEYYDMRICTAVHVKTKCLQLNNIKEKI